MALGEEIIYFTVRLDKNKRVKNTAISNQMFLENFLAWFNLLRELVAIGGARPM